MIEKTTNKKQTLVTCFMVVQVIYILINLFEAVVLFTQSMSEKFDFFYDEYQISTYIFGAVRIITAAALVSCLIYCKKGFSKEAAGFYKAFLSLAAVGCIANMIAHLFYNGFGPGIFMDFFKSLIFLTLAFYADLGKRNSMIILTVLIAVDLVFGFFDLSFHGVLVTVYRISTITSRLLITASVALAIHEKYVDKQARGTE